MAINSQGKDRRSTIGYVEGLEGELNGARRQPFYRVRLSKANVKKFLEHLQKCSETNWFTLTATYEKPNRLRITKNPRTPDYEKSASQIYLRGEAVRISGDQGSCNVDFSGNVGGQLLQDSIKAAQRKMRNHLDIRIRSRKRNLIEFIPDTESAQFPLDEVARIAESSTLLAGELLPDEDFSDWPGALRD